MGALIVTPLSNLLLLDAALRKGGTREFRGPRHNPDILEMFDDAGARWVDDDETAWCSAFMCWLADQVGLHNPRTIRARRWAEISEDDCDHVELDDMVPGDVSVLWRGKRNGTQGHVGLFLYREKRRHTDLIWMLGGNQGDEIQPRPYDANQFLAGIRLKVTGADAIHWEG